MKILREIYPSEVERVQKALSYSLAERLRELLEEKCLYQNVSVNIDKVLVAAKEYFKIPAEDKEYEKIAFEFATQKLEFKLRNDVKDATHQVPIPATINTSCEMCGAITPHNPSELAVLPGGLINEGYVQTICIGMQCQKCKYGRLGVLVKRDGVRLQFVGRNQIDTYTFPCKLTYFPNAKAVKAFFVDAVMAERTGSHLAAVCLLRVALEQFMRSAVAPSFSKMRGDELYDEFALHLPNDFPRGRVCSMSDVYGRLSEVMHNPACYKEGEFNELFEKLLNYFKYLEMLPLENVGKEIVKKKESQLTGGDASVGGGTNG